MSDSDMNEPDIHIRKRRKQRKAPQAPKKALTPYIFFSKELRPQVKESNPDAKVTEIVRIIAEKWGAMSDKEKAPYVKLAEEDKIRYNKEINDYDGPLHVPVSKKRGKQGKSPGAPKRAMSPFLFFSNEKRAQLQKDNPKLKLTEISALLGNMWRDMTDEEKEPYVQQSKADRDRYKMEQDEFKGKTQSALDMKEQTNLAVPIHPVIPQNQWGIDMQDTSTSSLYPRIYDLAPQTSNFTNISIPRSFNSDSVM